MLLNLEGRSIAMYINREMAVRFQVQHDSRCTACLFIGELVDLKSVRVCGVCGVSQSIVIYDHAAVGLVLLAVPIQEPHDAAAGRVDLFQRPVLISDHLSSVWKDLLNPIGVSRLFRLTVAACMTSASCGCG